jgi:site-specific recombinase XerD
LWKETVASLKQLLAEPSANDPERAVFVSPQGQALTRFGIYKIVRRHTRSLLKPGESRRRISPHIFRHTSAVHLLEAGVEVNVIRGWLGHVSLETTNRYAEINLRMKEAALQACQPPASASSVACHRKSVWREDAELLKWLKTL